MRLQFHVKRYSYHSVGSIHLSAKNEFLNTRPRIDGRDRESISAHVARDHSSRRSRTGTALESHAT